MKDPVLLLFESDREAELLGWDRKKTRKLCSVYGHFKKESLEMDAKHFSEIADKDFPFLWDNRTLPRRIFNC